MDLRPILVTESIVSLMIIHTSLIAKLLLVLINHRLSIKKCFDINNRHYIFCDEFSVTSEDFSPSGIGENFLCRALADVLVPLIVRPLLVLSASLGRRLVSTLLRHEVAVLYC